MLVRIDPSSGQPLFAQIAASVRGAMSRGDLNAGDLLPTVRDLASALDVNMHTVRAAYAELRDEGLVDMRRGRSVRVIANHPGVAQVHETVRGLIREARRLGMQDDEITRLVEESL